VQVEDGEETITYRPLEDILVACLSDPSYRRGMCIQELIAERHFELSLSPQDCCNTTIETVAVWSTQITASASATFDNRSSANSTTGRCWCSSTSTRTSFSLSELAVPSSRRCCIELRIARCRHVRYLGLLFFLCCMRCATDVADYRLLHSAGIRWLWCRHRWQRGSFAGQWSCRTASACRAG
jgi:hypothetical protein